MSFEIDDEILQDFLVEAGELLEQLGEQLVEIEQAPDDPDLLNAIFRNFHTIKGGAGFLNITALVNVCHKAEDVFNALRQGEIQVDADMMDTFLKVLDIVNDMFDEVKSGGEPKPADPELLDLLQSFLDGGNVDPVDSNAKAEVSPEPEETLTPSPAGVQEESVHENLAVPSAKPCADTISESEFDELLDQLHGSGKGPTTKESDNLNPGSLPDAEVAHNEKSADKLITEDEFEDLLDQLHGKGKHGTVAQSEENSTTGHSTPQPAKTIAAATETIQEDEFEDLLDQLHGKGKHGGKPETAPLTRSPAPAKTDSTVPRPVAVAVANPPIKENSSKAVVKKAGKPNGPAAESTVRVDVQRLDDIMNMVGELVLVRNRLENLKSSFDREQIGKSISNLDVVTSDLQRAVMKTRMQPIKKVFGRFPRVVRDLARSLNKEIRLELRGEETDLDKNLVEALADPLVHLVRNAVDHGVETPEEREVSGKSREGTVILTASQEGDHIQLMIEDDGKGMNADKLRNVVVEKGLMDEESAARLDDRECFNLIFMPGFSTKSEISDVSGRGVGMDVVKTRINQMNGSVAIDSEEGKGSKIIIKVPLTLAIMPTLMVKLDEQPFALPLVSVVEILDLDLNKTNVVDGQLVVMVRDHALPLFYLKDWLVHGGYSSGEREINGHVVVVNVGGRHVGFVVDHLIGQEEVVIKALGAKLQGLDGLSGATITGDGNIALILDVPSLMSKYAA